MNKEDDLCPAWEDSKHCFEEKYVFIPGTIESPGGYRFIKECRCGEQVLPKGFDNRPYRG